jgi:hypothetical protein
MQSDVQQGDEEVVLDNAQRRGEVTWTGGTGSTIRRTQSNCRRNAHVLSV